ncbi:MAG: hypothetical protein RL607_207 [Bacteroidota bacterium]|jgi:hypothetical protein
MPFTFAHPALLIPLRLYQSLWYSWTALIIGTMVPDFEYFFRLETVSTHSHTFWGLLYWDIPVGLFLFIVYNQLVKKVVWTNLPSSLHERLHVYSQPITIFSLRQFIFVCFSIYLGAITHVFWDAWTHPKGYFVNYFTTLQKEVIVLNYTIPYFKFAQHGSTLIGILAILHFIYRLPKSKTKAIPRIKPFWGSIIASTFIGYLIVYLVVPTTAIGALIVRGISLFMLSIIVNSITFYKSINRSRKDLNVK